MKKDRKKRIRRDVDAMKWQFRKISLRQYFLKNCETRITLLNFLSLLSLTSIVETLSTRRPLNLSPISPEWIHIATKLMHSLLSRRLNDRKKKPNYKRCRPDINETCSVECLERSLHSRSKHTHKSLPKLGGTVKTTTKF